MILHSWNSSSCIIRINEDQRDIHGSVCSLHSLQLSGINPATIKKYEYGIRNPKPDQLLKIANALGISINIFMNFEVEKDENGSYIPATLKISFTHSAVNKKLCTYLKAKQLQENIENNKYNFTDEQQDEAYQSFESDMEEVKNHLLDDNMIVKKRSTGIFVKVFPQSQ